MSQRKAAAVQAEDIVKQESLNFMEWMRSQSAVSSIRDYRSMADNIREELVEKTLIAIQQGADVESAVNDLSRKLTNRLIHAPTKSLQKAASSGDLEQLNLLRDSLGLDQC